MNLIKALGNLLLVAIAWLSVIASGSVIYTLTFFIYFLKPRKMKMREHFVYVLYSQDQYVNWAINYTNPDLTISGTVGYWAREGHPVAIWMERLINGMLFWDKNHCRDAIEEDEIPNNFNTTFLSVKVLS